MPDVWIALYSHKSNISDEADWLKGSRRQRLSNRLPKIFADGIIFWQSEDDTYGDGKMRLLMTGMAALFISGCNADMQQLARASCALTTECYAPGVAPGTNPYRY